MPWFSVTSGSSETPPIPPSSLPPHPGLPPLPPPLLPPSSLHCFYLGKPFPCLLCNIFHPFIWCPLIFPACLMGTREGASWVAIASLCSGPSEHLSPPRDEGCPFGGLWFCPDGLYPPGAWGESSLLAFLTPRLHPVFSCQPYWPWWKESLLLSPW